MLGATGEVAMGLGQDRTPSGVSGRAWSVNVLNFAARWRLWDGGRRYDPRPGSRGEHVLQDWYGTRDRAGRFYDRQLSDQLTPKMVEFIGRMEMAFIATSDAGGECDCSFRAGTAGFCGCSTSAPSPTPSSAATA